MGDDCVGKVVVCRVYAVVLEERGHGIVQSLLFWGALY